MTLPSSSLISGPQTFPAAPNLLSMVLRTARERGSAVAVVDGEDTLGYDALLTAADRVAAHLIKCHGVTKGDVVAVAMERSAAFVCVVLGIQRAGAVYLPVLPTAPAGRMEFILRDATAQLLVTDGRRTGHTSVSTVTAEALLAEVAVLPETQLPACGGDDIAYIAYTSGTSGQPKGVRVSHAGICNRIDWMVRYYDFGADDAILCKCPIDFDPSLFEIFMPLVGGGRIAILRSNVQLSGETLIAAIDRHQITFLNLVPIVLRQLVHQRRSDQCRSLRHIVCGGEAWEAGLIRRTHERFPQVELYNGYGPTEASIGVTIWKSDHGPLQGPPPIGQPIDNVHLLIADEQGNPVQRGAEGELWIGGTAVARGYTGDVPENANFVNVHFEDGRTMAFYKTGDLVRQLPDGDLLYIARRDQQVKINGVRVELEEIESVALGIAGIEQAAAYVNKLGGIAYVTLYFTAPSCSAALVERLHTELRRRVQPAAMPQRLHRVLALPTKDNGKLDRSRLDGLVPIAESVP